MSPRLRTLQLRRHILLCREVSVAQTQSGVARTAPLGGAAVTDLLATSADTWRSDPTRPPASPSPPGAPRPIADRRRAPGSRRWRLRHRLRAERARAYYAAIPEPGAGAPGGRQRVRLDGS